MPNALIRSFFDPATSTTNADALIEWVRAEGLAIDWLLETHAHADHLSAAPYLQRQLGGRIAIGAHIREVQRVFKPLFNAADLATDGSPFEQLFAEGERLPVDALEVEVMHTPGHHRSRVHRDAQRARPRPREAGAAAAGDAGQRARRAMAAGRSERRALPEDSAEHDVTRREPAQARPVLSYCHTTRWCLPTQRSNIGP
jgi:beta-lactamase superfamily II metal-dependent hydrolase